MLDETKVEEIHSAKFLEIYLDRGLTWKFLLQTFRDLRVEAAVKMLFDSGSDDGTLRRNIPIPLLQIGLVGRLRKYKLV